jgi:multicomponent Na+:H+ antiporter subunit A
MSAADLTLASVLGGLFILSALTPAVVRRLGRDAGYALAAAFAIAFVALVPGALDAVRGPGPSISIPWIPSLGVRISLRMDALGALFAGVIVGVGALVMAYTPRYLKPGGSHDARLYAQLVFFAAAMLGLVLAEDAIALFVFWELTSVASFFLIGGSGGPTPSRSAMRAFVVTGAGGLALLVGLVLLSLEAGSSDLGDILARAESLRSSGVFPVAAALLLLGIATKSALFPFHFWLPGAMVAPTPVSTYLHSATMVKAGIYLLLRTAPLFDGVHAWTVAVVLLGLGTAVLGASLALLQHDLKALLAYSTVSQLGFLAALAGLGTQRGTLAACAHLVAHALYKATLFMIVGVLDREAGSRDIRKISGLRKVMPLAAATTGLAGLSMAGFPPMLGFVSKEEAFSAFLSIPGGGWLAAAATALAVTASTLTFVYGVRIFEGAFGGPLLQPHLFEPSRSFLGPAIVTAAAGLVLGPGIGLLDPIAVAVAADATDRAGGYHLALWHGLTPALGMSAITVSVGLALVSIRRSIDRAADAVRWTWNGAIAFDRLYAGMLWLGARVGVGSRDQGPARSLASVLLLVVVAGAGLLTTWQSGPPAPPAPVGAGDWPVLALIAPAVAVVVASHDRIAAIAALGLVGFALALLYALLGGADLAITQVLVETLTVALVVLVFRRLPRRFPRVPAARVAAAAAVAIPIGVGAAAATTALIGRRGLSDAGAYFLEAAEPVTGGRNVVNTILVDFRAVDTLGEIAVLGLAAIGAAGLVLAALGRRS